MSKLIRATMLAVLIASLVAASAAAMVTSHGPSSIIRPQRNATRINQLAFLACMHGCEDVHKAEIDTCNALGSSFRDMRLKNTSAVHSSMSTVGQCVSASAQKFRDCKKTCKPVTRFGH